MASENHSENYTKDDRSKTIFVFFEQILDPSWLSARTESFAGQRNPFKKQNELQSFVLKALKVFSFVLFFKFLTSILL